MPLFKNRLDVTFEATQYARPKDLAPGLQVMVFKLNAGFVILKEGDWITPDGLGPDGYLAYQVISDNDMKLNHELAEPIKVSEPEPQEPSLTKKTRTL